MMRFWLLSLVIVLGMAAAAAAAQTAPPPPTSAAAPATPAAVPANPYSAIVPVAGTSDAQRSAAISAALAQVLQQVSPGFVATPDLLGQASGYVRAYHYRRAAAGGLELQVDFDPGALGRMVAQTQNGPGPTVAGQPAPGASAGSVAAAPGGTGTLWVSGLDNSHAFASLLSTLRGDPALHHVEPVAAQGDGVLLQVTSDRPLATVLAGLTGPGGHLATATHSHPGADASMHWVP